MKSRWNVRVLVSCSMLGVMAIVAISCSTDNANNMSEPAFTARSSDWRALFDGRSLDGWKQAGPGELRLENGELVTHGGMGLLWYTRARFSNCQIRVVFKLTAPKDNSGVFIRIPDPPHDEWDAVNKGYEVQIDNTGDQWHRTGCLYSFTKAQNKVFANVGDWNDMVITLFGPRTRVSVNGVPVTDFTEGDPVPLKYQWYEPDRGPRPLGGYIGLQNHADEARVHFKLVAVRSLR